MAAMDNDLVEGTVPEAVAELVRSQYGAVTHSQLEALGVPSRTVRSWLKGTWRTAHPGVMVNSCVPESFIQQCWAAHLAAGDPSALSHEAAARLHRLKGFGGAGVVINAPHGDHHRIADTRVHQIADMFRLPHHIIRIGGLPVSSLPRTLVDLGAVAHVARLRAAMDDALDNRKTTVEQIGRVVTDIARKGKRGLRPVARCLARHEPGPSVPRSHLERALVALLKDNGEPLPNFQARLPGRGVIDGLVDCMYEDARLILESDGRRWHARIAALAKDHLRDAEAAAAGYQTLRVMHEHVQGDPDGTFDVIHRTRLMRLSQLAA